MDKHSLLVTHARHATLVPSSNRPLPGSPLTSVKCALCIDGINSAEEGTEFAEDSAMAEYHTVLKQCEEDLLNE